MKRYKPQIVWFVAGGVLGFIASTFLHELWFALGWRQPLADWLVSRDLTTLAGYWGQVWLHLPDWFIAAVVGIGAGLLLKRQPTIPLLLFGLGFVVVPYITSLLAGLDFTVFSPAVLARAFAWSSVTILVAVLFGILSRQLRRRCIEHETLAA